MRKQNFNVFDEYLPTGTTAANPTFTNAELNTKLGHYDQLAIQVIIDNVSGSPLGGFDLYLEHSADGRNFSLIKSGSPVSGGGDVAIYGALSTSTVNLAYGFNNGSSPFLGFVRFRMFFSNATTAAHVRVHVTQRDQS